MGHLDITTAAGREGRRPREGLQGAAPPAGDRLQEGLLWAPLQVEPIGGGLLAPHSTWDCIFPRWLLLMLLPKRARACTQIQRGQPPADRRRLWLLAWLRKLLPQRRDSALKRGRRTEQQACWQARRGRKVMVVVDG